MRARALLTSLGLNAIPAIGWFVGEWSAGTMLVLYWAETLLGTLLVGLRIVLHRRARPSKGHFDYQAPQAHGRQSGKGSSYLLAFLVPALVFTSAHGIFLGALGLVATANHLTSEPLVNLHDLLVGLTAIVFFQVLDFLFDLTRLRERPFAWMERLGGATLGRVLVVHLTIIGGMMAMGLTGANRNFFGVFIFLKTLLNCSMFLPQWQPKESPAWLAGAMDRMPGKKQKLNFAQFWKQEDDEEKARGQRNEKPF